MYFSKGNGVIDKKKLKEQYKLMVPPKGVFVFKNNVTGKVLLGSSLNIKNIDVRIKALLGLGSHPNSVLQNDWNSYGADAFSYEVLETLELKDDPNYDYKEDLEILEMMWIDKFQPLSEKTYNKNEKIRMA
jgi:hypothetical protein